MSGSKQKDKKLLSMKTNHILMSFLVLVSLSSCVTNKKLEYLQYNGTKNDVLISVTPADYTILPYDNLFIRVVTPDPKWSEMFNTLPATSGGITMTEQSADLLSYTVDGEGGIQLPYAGRFIVKGKTLETIKNELETALKAYIADAVVMVKLVNNYVSLIGEVQVPGKYPIYKERMNIFQALAMAGDLKDFSDRQRIRLIRQTSKGNIVKEFNITDRSIITSESFYIMPNDVIYAIPLKGKFFQLNAFPYSVILSSITTFILVWTVLKK
jgi:polysaccharide export outer membrane protein